MKFYLVMSFFVSYVLLGLTLTCVKSHQSAEVRVTSQFLDGRHVTFACLSYKPFVAPELVALSFPIQPSAVTWTNQHFDGETVQKCHMAWREDDVVVRSMFEAFTGSHDHDDATDHDHTLQVNYIWLVNEYGLSRYSFKKKDFFLVKPMASLQYIGVNVVNFLGNEEIISILCISKEPSAGHKEVVALASCSVGGGVGWSIKDFNKETTQVCRVDFGHRDHGLVFQVFVGSWDHDDVSILDAIHTRRRIYYWVLRDTGLYRHNYHTNIEDFIQPLPLD